MEEVSRSDRGDDESPSSEVPGGWCPRQLGFKPYSQLMNTSSKFKALRVVVRRPVVARLTKHLVETYQACNAEFKYAEELNPKRFLTSPADGVLNEGHDNTNSDLILSVNYVLINSQTQQRYIVKDMLGHGTFGQVAKCWVSETNSFVAVKIIKNQPAYYQQAWVEVSILATLNKKFDPEDKHHIVRIYDYFVFQRHLCISFELLDTNLYELIKINNFRGLSLSIVQLFSKQILRGLSLMKDAGIVHCDLKPENILLCTRKPAEIKIIDFGSACMEDRTVYSYIQSRYYRSPEVLLGSQYNTAIDMWSFGCIVAELFLGLPLFPGASEFDLLKRMIRILGGQPPDYLLKESKNTSKFFKSVGIGSVDHVDAGPVSVVKSSAYQALTEDEYQDREKKKPVIGKEYFNYMDLEGIVAAYPYRKNLPEADILKEKQARLALIDFLRGLIEFDPARRWSPFQAAKHPFVTGEPFTCPYKPLPETPHVPVSQIFKVDHHPGGGHWFAAGFSPNVRGHNAAMHTGQHHQVPPYAHGNSYGSLGSHNSYNDCNGLGSSYGSYGENFNAFTVFSPAGPSAMNIHAQGGMSMVGTSPDARWRAVHLPQGLGASPSMGNLTALPLGTSPSQFTPPGSFTRLGHSSPSQFTQPGSFTQLGHSSPSQFTPPGSFTQLGHYGSPARGSNLGSPLGKGVAASNFNRRQSWGYAENQQYQEGSPYSHPRGHFFMGNCSSQGDGNPHLYGDPSHMPLKSYDSSMKFLQAKRIADENLDASVLPDPADWDPNYSDEQLLQDDSADASSIASNFSRAVHINQGTTYPQMFGVIGRFNHDSHTNSNPSVPRPNVPGQGYSKPDTWNPHNYMPPGPPGYGRSMPQTPMFLQQSSPTSPSRLGQIPIQRSNQGRSGTIHGNEGTHMKLQPSSFGYSPGNPHSPRGSSSFNNGNPWGRRTNPLVNIPPSPRGKKDYGRIA